MVPKSIEKQWNDLADETFVGRRIVSARYMEEKEAQACGWGSGRGRPLVLTLDDGAVLYPSQDDEGNGPGALHGSRGVFPVL